MDPYSVLGLRPGATEAEAKTAFRNLAKTCHPDLFPNNPEAEKRFKDINAAYDKIRNPTVDHFERFQQPNQDFQFRHPFGGTTPFDDLFANLHGFTRQPARNNDLHVEARLTLEDVFYGKEVEITLPHNGASRIVKVRIPPGVDEGTSLRVTGAGDHTNKQFRPGDLYLLVRVLPHNHLLRVGRNLTTIVPINAFDVLLGKEIEVVGIDGRALRVAIPAGFDTSRKLRLAGQGMPEQQSQFRGDLLIELLVMFPTLTDEQRALILQASGHAGGN